MGYFEKYKKGVDFMDGREKGELSSLEGLTFHIDDWGVIETKHGRCPVISVEGNSEEFFFGNNMLLEVIDGVEEDGQEDLLRTVDVQVKKDTTRDGKRTYWHWLFIED